MENLSDVKRILLNINYDSKNTLNENLQLLNEEAFNAKVKKAQGGNPSLFANNPVFTISLGKVNYDKTNKEVNGNMTTSGKAGKWSFGFEYDCAAGKNYFKMVNTPNGQFENTEFTSEGLLNYVKKNYCSTTAQLKKNMAEDNDKYWSVLKEQLVKAAPLVPYVKEGTHSTKGQYYYWGKFLIWRFGTTFVVKSPSAGVIINSTGNNASYAGQTLDRVLIKTDKNTTTTLLQFIKDNSTAEDKKEEKKEKVIDYTDKNNKGGGGNNTQQKKQTPIQTYDCVNEFGVGCVKPEVGQVQQCLKDQGLYNYTVDNKFGSRTLKALRNAIGVSSFTKADITTICKSDKGGGGNQNDFDQDFSEKEKSTDTTWTGEVY
jgi:hypothetical protein